MNKIAASRLMRGMRLLERPVAAGTPHRLLQSGENLPTNRFFQILHGDAKAGIPERVVGGIQLELPQNVNSYKAAATFMDPAYRNAGILPKLYGRVMTQLARENPSNPQLSTLMSDWQQTPGSFKGWSNWYSTGLTSPNPAGRVSVVPLSPSFSRNPFGLLVGNNVPGNFVAGLPSGAMRAAGSAPLPAGAIPAPPKPTPGDASWVQMGLRKGQVPNTVLPQWDQLAGQLRERLGQSNPPINPRSTFGKWTAEFNPNPTKPAPEPPKSLFSKVMDFFRGNRDVSAGEQLRDRIGGPYESAEKLRQLQQSRLTPQQNPIPEAAQGRGYVVRPQP